MGINRAKEYQWHIEWRNPKELIPYENNAKIHDEKQIKNIANSIKRYGWQQPGVITNEGVLIVGHGRRLAAIKLGVTMPVKVIEDDMTDEDIREYRLADNLTNESPWDFVLRDAEMAELDFEDFDFGIEPEEVVEAIEDDKYTMKVNIPQYEPTGEKPDVSELYDTDKNDELTQHILEAEGITDEEREFLIQAAHRHNVFNYRNIAEYYAQSSPEMQRLMEESALVIIDVDNAIANGYARLSEDIADMMGDDDDE